MRLIDADNLLIQIRQIDFLKEPNSTKLSACEIMKIINKQPIAYDVEKVVAELEESQFDTEIEEPILAETNVRELFEAQVVILTQAIDIVKRGGNNENSSR